MVDHSKLSNGLRENILAVLAGTAARDQLNRLVAACHSLAHAFIASKQSIGTLCSVSGLNTSDLAYDCIADLFQQTDDGRYLQLQAYFCGLQLATARDEEVLAHVRRLVFSKVNQGIYRLHSESDPSLAKILRNVKLAVYSLNNFTEVERFGEPSLVPSLCNTLEHLPPFERDELEQSFLPCVTGQEMIPEMLAKLSLFLREQDERCRIVPFISVGLLIRSAYERKRVIDAEVVSFDETLLESDTVAAIRTACAPMCEEKQP